MRRALLAAALAALAVAAPAHAACGGLGQPLCLLPFPSDAYTKPADTPTGLRLHLPLTGMPRNVAGAPMRPTDLNRSDGFSPGQMIVAHVPGLDPARTGVVPIGDMARSFDA